MSSNPEPRIRRAWPLACGLLAPAVLCLAACGSLPDRQAEETAARQRQAAQAASFCPLPEPQKPVACVPSPEDGAVQRLLAYADRVRLMAAGDLPQEIARLSDVSSPTAQMQLALVLSQLRQLPDLVRAQELLARVLGNPSAEAEALQPLARLLAARYGEQRRVEEQSDRQSQQLRDVQRRLDQTNERLEALKAIERSLSSRQPAVSAPLPAAPGASAVRRPAAP